MVVFSGSVFLRCFWNHICNARLNSAFVTFLYAKTRKTVLPILRSVITFGWFIMSLLAGKKIVVIPVYRIESFFIGFGETDESKK
jgi:hypothetical protein